MRVLRCLSEYEHLPRQPLTTATTVILTLTLNLILTLNLGGVVQSLFLTSSSEALAEGDEVRNV